VTERDELEAEREFQDFLKRKRTPFPPEHTGAEPSAELDAWVLERARQGIRPVEQPRPFRTLNWAVPFATAATVVVALAIFVNVEPTQPTAAEGEITTVTASRTTQAPPADASAIQPVTVDLQTRDESLADAAATDTSAHEASASARAKTESVGPAATAAPPAAVAPPKSARVRTFAVPPPLPAAEVAADENVAGAPQTANSAVFDSSVVQSAPESDASIGGGMHALRATPEAAAVGRAAEKARATTDEKQKQEQAVNRGVKAAWRDPAMWLAEIERLRAAGKHDEADIQLVEFRKQYPDYKPDPPPPSANQ
jgi:hypothetical protein